MGFVGKCHLGQVGESMAFSKYFVLLLVMVDFGSHE